MVTTPAGPRPACGEGAGGEPALLRGMMIGHEIAGFHVDARHLRETGQAGRASYWLWAASG